MDVQEHNGFEPKGTQPQKLTPKEIRQLKRQGVKARQRRRRIVGWVLFILLLALAAVPGYRMVYQPYQAKSYYKNLKNFYGQAGTNQLPKEYNQNLGGLYDINSDIGGWLIVPETDIDLPVVQTVKHDSVYYVNHLFDGTANPYGTPYYYNQTFGEEARTNTVIAGNSQLLGDLAGYKKLSFYKQSPTIYLDTLTDAAMYKIFAVVELTDSDTDLLKQSVYENANDFADFVNHMANRSLIATTVSVEADDRLITLVCDTDQGKIGVVARARRQDEDFAVDTTGAYAKTPGTGNAILTVTPTDITPSDVKQQVSTIAQ